MVGNDWWISVKDAASMYGLNAVYFRRKFCDCGGVLDRLGALRVRRGPKGVRRILILRSVIAKMIEREIIRAD
jgi:hypothetical protein